MSKRQKNGLYLFLGIAAGVAAGWYLNSKDGKKMRSKVAQGIDDVSKEIGSRVSDLDEDIKSYRRETIDKVNNVRAQLADAMSPIEN